MFNGLGFDCAYSGCESDLLGETLIPSATAYGQEMGNNLDKREGDYDWLRHQQKIIVIVIFDWKFVKLSAA